MRTLKTDTELKPIGTCKHFRFREKIYAIEKNSNYTAVLVKTCPNCLNDYTNYRWESTYISDVRLYNN